MAIYLNSEKIDLAAKFPDGTFAFRMSGKYSPYAHVSWRYEGEEELIALYYLTKYLRRNDRDYPVHLTMYYVPNARMDRTKSSDEVFTLKYFAEFINSLKFNSVDILDPHSSVATALLNNVSVLPVQHVIERVLQCIDNDDLVVFYPDEGAMKRYSDMTNRPYGFGVKKRDWRTGKIQGLKIEGDIDYTGKDVLIVDDICCRGGTFFHAAKALKDAGANHIYLYCTHCENTIFQGELLASKMIDGIYTTDSIFSAAHPKITVIPCREVF